VSVPPVSIVLLNWNGWRDTIECLESIQRLDYPNWNVVVCDNASTDDSVAHIRDWAQGTQGVVFHGPPELRHLVDPPAHKPVAVTELSGEQASRGAGDFSHRSILIIRNTDNGGFAAGNNSGLRQVREAGVAKYSWILNNDTIVAEDSLSKLVAIAESTDKVGAVGATIYEYRMPNEVQHAAGGGFGPWNSFGTYPKTVGTRSSPSGDQEADIDFITGSSILVPVATVGKIGLIAEEYFMYGEDVDYSLRIRQAGLKLLYAPEARVWHKGGASIGHRSPRHDYYAVRNALHLVAKYYPRLKPVTMTHLMYQVVLPKIVRGQWDRLAVVLRAYRDHVAGVFGRGMTDVETARS
jgi:GT2 family glycosyltransferase